MHDQDSSDQHDAGAGSYGIGDILHKAEAKADDGHDADHIHPAAVIGFIFHESEQRQTFDSLLCQGQGDKGMVESHEDRSIQGKAQQKLRQGKKGGGQNDGNRIRKTGKEGAAAELSICLIFFLQASHPEVEGQGRHKTYDKKQDDHTYLLLCENEISSLIAGVLLLYPENPDDF